MPRILLRSGKDPFEVLSPEDALGSYPKGVWGKNVGNLVFTDSMHRLLSVPDAEVVSSSFLGERPGAGAAYAARLDAEFDRFVIPLANAFRHSFIPNLERLTGLVERLTIPVNVVGVGVAGGPGSLDDPLPRLDETDTAVVRRFVGAVLDRSASIGVRGELTAEYLATLGFGDEHVRVVGCPSLYRDGTALEIRKKVDRITPESLVALNLTPYVPVMGEISVRHAERYPHLVYVPQDHDTAELMMFGRRIANPKDRSMPVHIDHPLYRENRMRYFVDSSSWVEWLATRDMAFGTRIHGNIAALLARTPAYVLAHDSRTLELSQYHEIPHRRITDVTPDLDVAQLHEEADYTAFNAGHPARFERFAAFLAENDLRHVHEPGREPDDYEARLAGTPFPGPIETLMADDPEVRRTAILRIGKLREIVPDTAWRKAHPPVIPFPVRLPATEAPATAAPARATAPARASAPAPAPAPQGVTRVVRAAARRLRAAGRALLGR